MSLFSSARVSTYLSTDKSVTLLCDKYDYNKTEKKKIFWQT